MNVNRFFSNKYLKILHQNIAGLVNKSNMLTLCLDELSEKKINVDVLCITEHFIMKGYQHELYVPNYGLAAYYCREGKKRGGACILVRHGIQWKELPNISNLSTSGLFECCAIELTDYKIIVVCIYRVPNVNNLNYCLDRLEHLLQVISRARYTNIVIAGDFNIDVLKQNSYTNAFEYLLMSYNLKLAIKKPTRLASMTCIDNIAHNFSKSCKTDVIELALSDHTAQLIHCPVQTTFAINYWYVNKRDYSTENTAKFKNYIKSLTFSEIYDTDDPNIAYNAFIDLFKLIYDLCFPIKLTKINVVKKPKWLSKGIKLGSRKKRKLLWQFRLNPNKTNKKCFTNYSQLHKKIINLTQKAQNNHKIKSSNNKSKTTWQLINRAKYNLPKYNINKIKLKSHTLTDPNDIAEEFNNYFIDKVQGKLQVNSKPKHCKINTNSKSMFMAPSVPLDIHKIIMSLKNTNSVGYDCIATKILKSVSMEICNHLSYILNLSISAGIYPDALKISIVKPLFKKENREQMEYYRPISLIPVLSKVFEKYIYKELYKFIEKFNILCEEQKGFRIHKTINMAIYDFLYNVLSNVDKRNPVCSIFCDMTQAFDYVHYPTLISKLEAYGIRGNVLSLLESYLKNRIQKTEITKINIHNKREEIFRSTEREVLFGVPQGSVLGPFIFILYINDLPKCIKHPVTLFADDSTITIPCQVIESYRSDINNSLEQAVNWLDSNNLKINLTKTKIIHFRQRTPSININIQHGNNIIEEVVNTKFLGLIIDQKLNWESHIDTLCKKISKSAYALHTLSSIVYMDALLTAYYGLVESHLRYGIIFWGNSSGRETAFKAQKRCIRAIFKLQTTDSCMPYFKEYNILTLPCLYILEIALFVKSNPNKFQLLADNFPRSRRNNSLLYLQTSKTALMRKSVYCMAPVIYNKIPKQWKELPPLKFKKKLRKFLLNKSYYSISEFLNEKDFTI